LEVNCFEYDVLSALVSTL